MGGLRDDLGVHERALDVLIELMKKEQLDESVPLHGVEKAISHFEVCIIPLFNTCVHRFMYMIHFQCR